MSQLEGKTEQPTGKRKSELRKKGEIAKSFDFNTSAVFLFSVFLFFSVIPKIYLDISNSFKYAFNNIGKDVSVISFVGEYLKTFFSIIIPYSVFIMLFAYVISAVPSGYIFIKPKFKFSNLNFFNNLKKLFNFDKLFETIKSFIKLIFIILIIYKDLFNSIDVLFSLPFMDYDAIISSVLSIIKPIVIKISFLLLIIGILDLSYKIYSYKKNIKMTKQEIKEEFKSMEGNPQVKGKIRSMMRQFTKKNKLSSVSQASVVIVNPTHYAVALRYDKTMNAPRVVAKGIDWFALKIIEIAKQNNIPIKREPPLARALYRAMDVGDDINPIFYRAVAKILSAVYKERKKA